MSLPVCKTPCLSALKSNELLDVRTVLEISSVTVPIHVQFLSMLNQRMLPFPLPFLTVGIKPLGPKIRAILVTEGNI